MADYTLKIDIDERELTAKLQRALGGARIGGGGSPTGGGGTTGFRSPANIDRFERAAKMQMLVKEKDFQARTEFWQKRSQMAQALNTQKEKEKQETIGVRAKLLGRKGRGEKLQAQLVKIAGFAAGITGIASFGKAIIDSSPLLQAMMKLFQVSIMFILRPIGDFIGFVLRPFILALLPWAVKFYKKYGGIAALETAADVVTSFGDLGAPFGTPEGNAAREANQQRLTTFLEQEIWTPLVNWWDSIWSGGSNSSGFLIIPSAFADTGEEIAKEVSLLDQFIDGMAKLGEQLTVSSTEGNLFTEVIKRIHGVISGQTTLGGFDYESGDVTDTGQGGARSDRNKSNKYVSQEVAEKLTARMGQAGFERWMESRGYAGVAAGTEGFNRDVGARGITVNVDKVDLNATDAQIGKVIREEVQNEVKKYGRRF